MKIRVEVGVATEPSPHCTVTVLDDRGFTIGHGPVSHAVQIISTPLGEAPAWVREAWVGLEFPTFDPAQTNNPGSPPTGIFSGKPAAFGYTVPALIAFHLLQQKAPKAYAWWKENAPAFFSPSAGLCFDFAACEVRAEGPQLHPALLRIFSQNSSYH